MCVCVCVCVFLSLRPSNFSKYTMNMHQNMHIRMFKAAVMVINPNKTNPFYMNKTSTVLQQ